MRTRDGMIVPGTIVPIRRRTCYCTYYAVVARFYQRRRGYPNRVGGADPNEAKVSPPDQRELESFAL
jgi:hypothetical protein